MRHVCSVTMDHEIDVHARDGRLAETTQARSILDAIGDDLVAESSALLRGLRGRGPAARCCARLEVPSPCAIPRQPGSNPAEAV